MRKSLGYVTAALLWVATGAQAQNLVTNGTFSTPDLPASTSSAVTTLSFSDLNWGYFNGGSGQTQLVDNGTNQFAQVGAGDFIYTNFSVATDGQYAVSFDFNGSGIWGLTGSAWVPEVVAPTAINAASWTTAPATLVSLTAGSSYKLYFETTVTPPAFASTFQLDNVSVSAVTPVPEPESMAMMLAGLGALGLMSRRRLQR